MLKKLTEELEGAKKISISFFLYNNPYLHTFIEEMAKNGCEINIYTIPLNGYDVQKKRLYKSNYADKDAVETSKLEYAQKVYDKILSSSFNINLNIFPYTYIWKEQRFSRGSDLYSLHNKSILAEFSDGWKCITSSCNFALGDPPHSDSFLVINGDSNNNAVRIFKEYFSILDQISLSYSDYCKYSENYYDFDYSVSVVNLKDTFITDYFTAPFIKYDGVGSNRYVHNKILEMIKSAQERIYICSQHFGDILPFNPRDGSIVEALKKVEKKVDIKVLKQTRPWHQASPMRTDKTEKELRIHSNISQKVWHPIVHDKFIIVDNKVLVTTGNFMPTQFAWSDNRTMKYIVGGEQYERVRVFSEVNSYHFLEDAHITENYEKHFNHLWEKSECF
ncbi:phospholipase D family protein [Priestia megaterium]|uniref:phospholipase D family protein n=1 Tax=Priestia megaterium TaxID=1404 RepID=UPI0028775BED|nr:phospholipase D family protein [Priestia megaterium]